MQFAGPRYGAHTADQQDRRLDTALGLRLFRFPQSRPWWNGQHQRRRQTFSMAGLNI